MNKIARIYAIAGFLMVAALCALTNLPGTPVFSTDSRASALTYDESTMYAAGVNRFASRGTPAWEIDVFEMRDARFAYPVLHQIVLGTAARVCGSVDAVWRAAHILLPACVWLLIFVWVNGSRGHPAMAFVAAWTAVVVAAGPRNALLLGTDAFIQPLEFTRTPQPSFSSLLLLLAMTGLVRVLTRERTAWLWITGPLFGSLFYSYYFHAVAGCTLLAAVVLWETITRGARWRRLWIVALSGAAVSLPYVLWTLQSLRSGISHDLMARIGEFTRAPSWPAVAGLLVCGCAFVWFGRTEAPRRSHHAWLLCGLLVGAFVLANLQIITGYNAQHEHAWNRIIQPFGVVLLACLIPWRTAWLHGISAAIVCLAAVRQTKVAEHQRAIGAPDVVLAKLAEDRSPDLVVGVLDESVRGLMPTLTRHWSFVPIGCRTLISNEEILTRFIIVARLGGVSHDQALALLKSPAPSGAMRTFAYGFLDDFAVKAEDVERFEKLWREFDDPTAIARALVRRRLDVLLVPSDRTLAPVEGVQLTPLDEAGAWRIIRVALSAPSPAR